MMSFTFEDIIQWSLKNDFDLSIYKNGNIVMCKVTNLDGDEHRSQSFAQGNLNLLRNHMGMCDLDRVEKALKGSSERDQ
jgi:hypothetical protein